jgi:hypothetical protein
MGRVLFVGVLLGVAIAVPGRARAEEPAGAVACVTMPANVDMPPDLDAALTTLLAQSSTLRRECAAIAAASDRAHIVIQPIPPDTSGARARTSFVREARGRLNAYIDVPFDADFPELIAHEFEHVVEQIEGLNLRRLTERRGSGVREAPDGSFETARACAAGRAAAREVDAERRLERSRRSVAMAVERAALAPLR